jgi:glycosyltransferase involved in cell wall biosynthesis
VDFFVTPSVFARDWLIQQGNIPAKKIQAVGNPVQRPLADPVVYEPTRRTYLGYVGRFAPEKGVDVLLRAATLAGLPVHLAGDHRGFKPAEGYASFRFEGPLRGAALERFFAGMRCLVMPSVWFETYGMVAAEAMLRGIPVVCSNLGAMAEMVEDGVTGRLFPPGDVDALARLLRELWTQPEVLQAMSTKARDKAQQFLPDLYIEKLEAIYALLFTGVGGPADEGGGLIYE